MRKEEIISKGKYSYSQPDQLISTSEYLFVRGEDGKKRLLLRFYNNRQESCSRFNFIVRKRDSKGTVLGEERLECNCGLFKGKSKLSFGTAIDVEEKCTDFVVIMLSATYGSYTYHLENDELSVSYNERQGNTNTRGRGSGRVKPRTIKPRTFEMPWTFVLMALVVLAVIFSFLGYQLKQFIDSETTFTLTGITYTFADEAKTQVRVTGCSENYSEIIIPEYLDGYKVVGIDSKAFMKNETLKKVVIHNVDIGDNSFSHCKNLQEVEINNVKTIADSAFYGCSSLKKLTIVDNGKEDTIAIGRNAFALCTSLIDVSIGADAICTNGLDIFYQSYNIKSLYIRGMKDLDRISSLYGEGSDAFVALEGLTIDKLSDIPASFCEGLKKLRAVDISKNNISTIDRKAFCGCSSLEELKLKSSPKVIKDYALAYTGIKTIDGSALTTIGTGAFMNSTKLEGVEGLEKSHVTVIPSDAFNGCEEITVLSIPTKVTKIGERSFANTGLKEIVLPETIADVGFGAFLGCEALEKITIATLSNGYIGYLFGAEKDNSINEHIPSRLNYIKLQRGTEIPSYAFAGCENVKKIDLPAGITAFGDYAFDGCVSLETIVFPSTLKSVGQYAFSGTKIDTAVLTTAEYIGVGALASCTNLKSVALPFLGETADSPKKWISHVFGDSEDPRTFGIIPDSLTSVTVTAEMESIPYFAFYNCKNVSTFNLSGEIKEVGRYSFGNCRAMTSFDFSKLTSIAEGAFNNTGFETVSIPEGISVLNGYAFADCENLKSVTFPSTLKSIEKHAFLNDKLITELTLPQGLESIGDTAFEGMCLTRLEIPSSVTYIGTEILRNCDTLESLTIPLVGYARNSYQIFGKSGYEITALKSLTINGGESIEAFAFPGMVQLQEVSLDGISRIEYCAFESCLSLNSATFGSTVEYVDSNAFYGCYRLYEILNLSNFYIEKGAEGVGKYALYIGTSQEAKAPSVQNEGYTIKYFDGVWYLVGAPLGQENVVIPSSFTYEGAQVSTITIPKYLFYNESTLYSVTIPSIVINIQDNAFEGCTNLYDVFNLSHLNIVEGSKTLGNVGRYAVKIHSSDDGVSSEVYIEGLGYFRHHGNNWLLVRGEANTSNLSLGSFTYEGKTVSSYRIKQYAFAYNSTIKSLKIGNQVKAIYENAFMECYYLNTLSFEGNTSINIIEDNCFYNCSQLRTVVLPSTVTSIRQYAFANCYNIESIALPNNLNIIGEYAFVNCQRLVSITIPASVSSIGASAFEGCYYLYEVKNLSNNISLTMGDTNNGYVAYYAKGIFTDSMSGFEKYEANGFKLIKADGIWYLYSYTGTDKIATVPALTGSIYILPNAFISESIEGVVIPKNIDSFMGSPFYNCYSLSSIYFKGDYSEWNTIEGSWNIYYTIYFYNDCVHTTQDWTYRNNQVSLELCELTYTVVVNPTCTTLGEELGSCKCLGCTYTESREMGKLEHKFKDNKCEHCGADKIAITGDNISSYSFVTTDGLEYDATSSRFKNTSSSALLTIVADKDITVTITYGLTSGNGYIALRVNNYDYSTIYWASEYTEVFYLSSGDVFTINMYQYSQDEAGVAYISGLELVR